MKIIPLLGLTFSFASLAIDPCTDPFSSTPTNFYLVSPVYCGTTDQYQYWISPNSNLPSSNSGYLDIVCVDNNAKAMNLYVGGTTIIDFSNPVVGAKWGDQVVSSACNGNTVFSVDKEAITYNSEVLTVTNNANEVQINAANGTVLASAIRHLIPNQNPLCATTTWQVQNAGGLPGAVMSFFLSFKDNAAYTCPVTAAPNPQSSQSNTLAIGLVISAITAAVVSGGFIYWYKRYHLKKDVSSLMQDRE